MVTDEMVEKAINAALKADIIPADDPKHSGVRVNEYLFYTPAEAVELGVHLTQTTEDGKPRWHGFTDIMGDEHDDTNRAILRPVIRAALEAALSAAEPVEQDENPMRFFADNVDKWGALEWFNRLVDACEDHDRKLTKAFRCEDPDEKDMLSLPADTSRMIMSSSAFRLAREHRDEIRNALAPQPAPSVAVKAIEAVWKYSLVIESSVRRGDGPDQYKGVTEALRLVKEARSALSAQVQDVAEGWHVASNSGSVLIYCLKQDGWRKGEPVMVNDIMIRVENANRSSNDLQPIVDAIRRVLPAAPAKQEG
jgi:hypothetical protein